MKPRAYFFGAALAAAFNTSGASFDLSTPPATLGFGQEFRDTWTFMEDGRFIDEHGAAPSADIGGTIFFNDTVDPWTVFLDIVAVPLTTSGFVDFFMFDVDGNELSSERLTYQNISALGFRWTQSLSRHNELDEPVRLSAIRIYGHDIWTGLDNISYETETPRTRVPESGSTVGLLLVGCAALAGLKRISAADRNASTHCLGSRPGRNTRSH